MGWNYTRTYEGKIAIWSTIVDDFIFEGTDEEAYRFAVDDYVEEISKKVKDRIGNANVEDYIEHKRSLLYIKEGHDNDCDLNKIKATEETVCSCSARPGKRLGEE